MTSNEIRQKFLEFFKKRGHVIIPSASLVPENDPSVLFNTAGMQPLVPYLLGAKHPQGTRLADIQKCVRTIDIDEVGDNTHLTFFEMMGNWSLGDYWKEDAIRWSYELLTNSLDLPVGDAGFGLDPKRLYVTVFAGDENAEKDLKTAEIWESVGIPKNRIYFKDSSTNWWPAVKKDKDLWSGPTGPCSEMFYDVTKNGLGDLTQEEYDKADDEQKVVEIWNDVFMEFKKDNGKIIGKLENKNVDTGAGFERVVAVIQGKESVFDTDLFSDVIEHIQTTSGSGDSKAVRIIADHVRTAAFMIADGVEPSNTDRGYILRRLIRRARYYYNSIGLSDRNLANLLEFILPKYSDTDYRLDVKKSNIQSVLSLEEIKFSKTLEVGTKHLEKLVQKLKGENQSKISAEEAFILFSTYGFPIELTLEIARDNVMEVDLIGFKEEFKKHQELSRSGSEQKFKGGLSGSGEMETKYHTTTHLLHQALRDILGDSVQQKGSNITSERLRFDFAFERKMTDDEKKRVEDTVNEKIKLSLPVKKDVMKKSDAEKTGALHFFGDKYGDEVNVYYIGDSLDSAYSKEFCGGPHIDNTGTLGIFKIQKEEAVSAGTRRIKATLE